MKFDEFITQHLGGFGCHQKITFIIVLLPTLFCAFHSLSWTFTAPALVHRCRTADEITLDRNSINYKSPLGNELSLNESQITCEEPKEGDTCETFKSCTLNGKDECPHGYAFADYSRYTAVERVSKSLRILSKE